MFDKDDLDFIVDDENEPFFNIKLQPLLTVDGEEKVFNQPKFGAVIVDLVLPSTS